MKKRSCLLIALLVGAAFIAVQIACKSKPTERAGKKASEKLHLKGYYRSLPWKQGGRKDAMKMALAGQTIPLAQYSFTASKDGQKYTGVLVGTNPFAKPLGGATVNAVIVPLKVTIGSVAFDPTATDSCDSNVSALTRFRQSPLANDVPDLTFNGVNVGDAQYINGFRRAPQPIRMSSITLLRTRTNCLPMWSAHTVSPLATAARRSESCPIAGWTEFCRAPCCPL